MEVIYMNKKMFMKVSRKTTQIERQADRLVKRFAFIAILIGVLGAIQLSNVTLSWLQSKEIRPMYVISLKDQSITFQTPLRDHTKEDDKFHSPIPVVNAEETKESVIPSSTPTPSQNDEEAMVKSVKHGDILWKQYQLETQRGLTDWCRLNSKGFGGFGVKDGTGIVCYSTFKQAVERASYWADQLMEGRTLHSYLCKWSGAGDVADCLYARSYEFVK
jgi:hypothetical protein